MQMTKKPKAPDTNANPYMMDDESFEIGKAKGGGGCTNVQKDFFNMELNL